jgi:plasmid stabilization system protein ParE
MSLPVELTKRAKQEWDAAYEYWAKHRSEQQAVDWYNAMADTIEGLNDRPEQWPLARENDRTVYELRERHFSVGRRPTHRILFTIRPVVAAPPDSSRIVQPSLAVVRGARPA